MGLRLIGEVALDGSGFESGLKKLEHSAEHAGEILKGLAIAAVGVYGIEEAIHKTIETAEKLIDTSKRLGVGLEALQEIGYAAKTNGADIDQLTSFIEKLNSTRIDPKKFESFAKLGINQSDLSNLKVEDLIMKLSVNLRNRSSQEVIGPLRDIGGKGAGAMLATLKDNLEEVREEARRLGIVMKTQDAVMLKFVADEMITLSQIIVARLAPSLVFLEEKILQVIDGIKANFAFLTEFTTGKAGQSIKALFKSIFTGGLFDTMPVSEFKQHIENIKKGFEEAGAKSAGTLLESKEVTDQRIDELQERFAKAMATNALPDFDSVMGSEKEKKGRSALYTDSLVGVGNFLGSAKNPMISIAQTHTVLLRQIAHNTAKKAHGGKEPGHTLPHH